MNCGVVSDNNKFQTMVCARWVCGRQSLCGIRTRDAIVRLDYKGSQTIPVGDLDLSDFEVDLWDLPHLECTSHHPNATLLQCFSVFVLMVRQR